MTGRGDAVFWGSHSRELIPSGHAGESDFLLTLSVEEMGTVTVGGKKHFLLSQRLCLIFLIIGH